MYSSMEFPNVYNLGLGHSPNIYNPPRSDPLEWAGPVPPSDPKPADQDLQVHSFTITFDD